MLPLIQLAHLEHRERIRDFNIRAARGEFIRYADDEHAGARFARLSERLGKLGRAVRHRLSRRQAQRLVARPGADSG